MKARHATFAALVAVGTCGCNALLGISLLDGTEGADAGPEGGGVGDAGPDVFVPDGSLDAQDAPGPVPPDGGPDAIAEAASRDGDAGCYARPSGLVSWWRAEGSADDYVGPNNGTPSNVTFVPGVVGQAFHFAGDGGISADTAGLPTGASERTVEMWVRIDASYPDTGLFVEGIFFGYGGWGTDQDAYTVVVAGGGPVDPLHGDSLVFSNWGDTLRGSPLSENAWHHVAVTLSAGGTLTVYLDGQFNAGGSVATFPVHTAGGSVRIGGLVPSTDPCWLTGAVDEVAVYTRALDATEIQGIFSAGSAGKCP